MAAFPAYVKIIWPDTLEQATPVVARSDVERGIARQRRIAADSVVSVSLNLLFEVKERYAEFEDWFYSATGANAGAGWFDLTHPRTGATVQARVVGGQLGQLRRLGERMLAMPITIEYVRSTL